MQETMRKEIFETFKTFEKYEKLYESYLNEAKEEQETEEVSDNEEDATETDAETDADAEPDAEMDAEAVEEPPVSDGGTQALANGLLTAINTKPPHLSKIPFEKQTITPENLKEVIDYLSKSLDVSFELIEEDKR